ncbi:MAG: Ig-like domain-containing protein [candidate division WOR-3 bacterium]|nr:Ig-like domain-containing protein [candidate division WOR-3 bacterium]
MILMRNAAITVVFSSLLILQCGEETLDVAITQPVDGAEVSGIVRIEAQTSNNTVSVVFYADDVCIDTCRAAPFVCCWNTFAHADSSSHYLYAIGQDRKGDELCSDSVLVLVYNGNMIFADDFEAYSPNSYPYAGWFEIWAGAGSNHTYVDDQVSYSGVQSFRLRGLGDWVRTDGVELDLSGIQQLTYELNVMVPSQDSAGALFGFFALINPTSGMIYNGVLFEHSDGLIYAHGAIEDSTGHLWLRDTWYSVRVSLDYVGLSMSVWLDDEQIVSDLPAVPREWTDTFAIATEYGAPGIVYYDDVSVFQHE